MDEMFNLDSVDVDDAVKGDADAKAWLNYLRGAMKNFSIDEPIVPMVGGSIKDSKKIKFLNELSKVSAQVRVSLDKAKNMLQKEYNKYVSIEM